jgi:hypothetical protein
MKKQKTVNTVKHNDDFSSGLMEQYSQWMGGNCFQNTDPVDLNLHEAPFDGMDPQSHGAEVEEITKKKKSAKKESPKAQLDIAGDTNEESVVEEGKKAKKDYDGDGKVESGKAEYFGSKDKAIKKAMKKEDSTYGYDKKGNSLNPKDKKKAMKKEDREVLEREEFEVDGETYVLEKVKMDGVDDNGNTSCWKGYKKQGTKAKGGKEVNNCVKAGDEVTHDGESIAEKYKNKKIAKIMSYKK